MQSLEMNLDSTSSVIDAPVSRSGELRRSPVAPLLVAVYRLLHGERRWKVARFICAALLRLEGKGWRSATVRDLLRRYHHVEVGAYSYGECMVPGLFPPGVVIGRYTSIASGVRVFNQNHPLEQLSMHPYFYEPQLGIIEKSHLSRRTLAIGHDVWIGQNAIITPGCSRVGNGAVIGAGAVVTKDVDDFAIVAGNPARLIRHRFSEPLRSAILKSRWWERPIDELAGRADLMTKPLAESDMDRLRNL